MAEETVEGKRARKQVRNLGFGEFLSPDQNQNTEIAGARWQFVRVVSRLVPTFFVLLHSQVFPLFAAVVDRRPSYWDPEWSFETWQQHSDPDPQFTLGLIEWARSFHAEQTWIFDGALKTLWRWYRDPKSRQGLDIDGFRTAVCVDTLTSDEERKMIFEHVGWDPQLQKWSSWRPSVEEEFKNYLDAYRESLVSLMKKRGAKQARIRYSIDHFEWFASFQLLGLSATEILKLDPNLGEESNILKGLKNAARLMQWKNIRKVRKPQTRRPR